MLLKSRLNTPPLYRIFSLAVLLLLAVGGCTPIRPSQPSAGADPPQTQHFSYEAYARVLSSFVNEKGLVNYAGLTQNPEDLDRFYHQVASVSPDSHPQLFPAKDDQLAYWINAYNATVMKGVVAYYPITSVAAVKPPALLFFFPSKSGFFFFQRFTYGSKETSLYVLENRVIRERFNDPRIHFVLNCASSSCPELPQRPFYPESLEQQLEAETAAFINSPENVRYDSQSNVLYLSSIFDWYQKDFVDWLDQHVPGQDANLINYVGQFLPNSTARALRENSGKLTIVYLPYDWTLNDLKRPL